MTKGIYKISRLFRKPKIITDINRKCKKGTSALGVVFVDVAKAFSRVSHSHIITALKQKGVDNHIVALILNLYDNVNTYTALKKEQLGSMVIWTDVNAMSPILFNLPMDPLLC